MSDVSMSATARVVGDPLRWLPLLVVAVLLAVGVLLAPVSMSWLGGGPFRIDVGGVTGDPFPVTRDDLTCRPVQGRVRCEAQVGGQRLMVVLPNEGLSCLATHGERRVGCERSIVVGPESRLLRISDQLGVDAAEAAAWRARAPWWRTWTEKDWYLAGLLLVATLVAAAGAAGWLLSGRPRPALAGRRRVGLTLMVGLLGWVLPAVTGALLQRPADMADVEVVAAVLLISHSVLVPAALLAVWQWVLGGSITGRPGQRLRLTGAGMVITFVYSVPMTLWLLLAAGLLE